MRITPLAPLALAFALSPAGTLLAAPPKPPKPPAPPEPPDVVTVLDHDGDVDVSAEGSSVFRITSGPRVFLGVGLVDLTPELREHFGAPRDAGVMISSVEAGSPAAKAGLEVGDIVTKADDSTVETARDLSRAVRWKDAGEKISLVVTRGKAAKTIEVTVAASRRASRDIRIDGSGMPHAWSTSWAWPDSERFEAQMRKLQEKLSAMERKLAELKRRLRTN